MAFFYLKDMEAGTIIGIGIGVLAIGGMVLYMKRAKKKAEVKIEYVDYIPTKTTYIGNKRKLSKSLKNYKIKNELQVPVEDKMLTRMAQKHVDKMIKLQVVSHDGFPERHMYALQRGFLIDEITNGEYGLFRSLFPAYVNSPEHKESLDKNDHTHFGIGYGKDSDNQHFSTIILGKRNGKK